MTSSATVLAARNDAKASRLLIDLVLIVLRRTCFLCYHQPIANNLSLALKVTWAILVIVWVVGAFTSKRTVRRQSWKSRVGVVGAAVVECWVLVQLARYFGWAERRIFPDTLLCLWIGLLLTIAGVLFAIWARITLGRNWSGTVTVKQDHELIRTGPYALMRHPIYTGFFLALLGTTIFDGRIQMLILFVVALTVLIQKIKVEEDFMTEQFGTQYDTYRQTTKTLVPFVW